MCVYIQRLTNILLCEILKMNMHLDIYLSKDSMMWQVLKFLSSLLSKHRTDAVHSPPRHAGVTVPTD